MYIHGIPTGTIVQQTNTPSADIVHQREAIRKMQLVHGILGNVTQMHEDASQGVFVAGNQHSFSSIDGFVGDAFGIKGNLRNEDDAENESK